MKKSKQYLNLENIELKFIAVSNENMINSETVGENLPKSQLKVFE